MWCKVRNGSLIAVLMVVAACGSNDSANGAAEDMSPVVGLTETEQAAPATEREAAGGDESRQTEGADASEPLTSKDAVLAAYEAAIDAVVVAYEAADPEHPDLLAAFDGNALARHQMTLAELQSDGLSEVQPSPAENDPQVISVKGDTAVVEDCYVEVLQLVDAETREPRGQPREDMGHVKRRMKRRGGTWKIVRGQPLGESCPPRR